MATTTPQPGTKKRQVIATSRRVMFGWVAAMSAVVGICAVLAYFLVQQIIYKGDVAAANETTARNLSDNLKVIPQLRNDLQAMETNSALNSAKANADEKALRVILDALPADPNTLALGSSLQSRLAGDIPDLTVDSLSVLPYDTTVVQDNSDGNAAQQLAFTITVKSGSADSVKQLLTKFERSIRTIDIDSVSIERSESGYTMSLQAHAYYEPAKTVELGSETILPNGKVKKN